MHYSTYLLFVLFYLVQVAVCVVRCPPVATFSGIDADLHMHLVMMPGSFSEDQANAHTPSTQRNSLVDASACCHSSTDTEDNKDKCKIMFTVWYRYQTETNANFLTTLITLQ